MLLMCDVGSSVGVAYLEVSGGVSRACCCNRLWLLGVRLFAEKAGMREADARRLMLLLPGPASIPEVRRVKDRNPSSMGPMHVASRPTQHELQKLLFTKECRVIHKRNRKGGLVARCASVRAGIICKCICQWREGSRAIDFYVVYVFARKCFLPIAITAWKHLAGNQSCLKEVTRAARDSVSCNMKC